jgi:hypothetical protein
MINIFVSRPTWVAPEFTKGLDGFLGFLSSLGFRPRTLGSTDYPTKAPLDEVIRLLDDCGGLIVIGYPQIVVEAGFVKGVPAPTNMYLASEWNHIEAGLGYARGLPLLVIHHVGVTRGIFDHGALPNYIHSIDLSDPAWALSPAVQGAVKSWGSDVMAEKGKPASSLANSANAGAPASDLPPEQVKVLQLLADAGDDGMFAEDVAAALGSKTQLAQFHLEGLLARDLVADHMVSGEPTVYLLDTKGRALLAQRGLL